MQMDSTYVFLFHFSCIEKQSDTEGEGGLILFTEMCLSISALGKENKSPFATLSALAIRAVEDSEKGERSPRPPRNAGPVRAT